MNFDLIDTVTSDSAMEEGVWIGIVFPTGSDKPLLLNGDPTLPAQVKVRSRRSAAYRAVQYEDQKRGVETGRKPKHQKEDLSLQEMAARNLVRDMTAIIVGFRNFDSSARGQIIAATPEDVAKLCARPGSAFVIDQAYIASGDDSRFSPPGDDEDDQPVVDKLPKNQD